MDVPEIEVDELAEKVAAGAKVVDVRHDHEYEEGHVPSAVLIPLPELPDRLAELPDESFYVICRSGGRSRRAAEFLRAQGHEVVNVSGGMLDWVDRDKPVAEGSEPG